jgi:hypothetical protein
MKKILILLFLVMSPLVYSQIPKVNNGTYPGDNSGEKLFYAFAKVNRAIDSLNNIIRKMYSGTMTLNAVQIGGSGTARLDSITSDGSGLKFFSNGNPVPTYIPSGNTIHIASVPTIAKVVPSSGDTSVYPIPERIGIIYIDSTGHHVYVSAKSGRNGWIKFF